MNNFDEEKEHPEQEQELQEDDDIEFDDNIDIDALQKQLQAHISVETPEEGLNALAPVEPQHVVPELAKIEPQEESSGNTFLAPAQSQSKDKKYVIYITPENVDFIEGLSVTQRKNIINTILHEQDEASKKRKQMEERKQFTKHVAIAILTIIFGFPLLFLILNKSIQVTITNYQQAQQNFIKLYKEQGKIKSYDKFKSRF